MVPLQSLVAQLSDELTAIELEISGLQQQVPLAENRHEPGSGVYFVGRPRYYWDKVPVKVLDKQAALLERYRRWFEAFSRCYSRHSIQVSDSIAALNQYISQSIQLTSSHHVMGTHTENRERLHNELKLCQELLPPADPEPPLVLVVDTNALLAESDPVRYRDVVGREAFEFVIVPAVLAELDHLKLSRGNSDLAIKADSAIRRLKGYRNQGSVRTGVVVDRHIRVRMVPTEPDMAHLPVWLDPSNTDDRIIASSLEVQFSNLASCTVLVTNDMNLQNKAEMTFLPWAEPPKERAKGQGPS